MGVRNAYHYTTTSPTHQIITFVQTLPQPCPNLAPALCRHSIKVPYVLQNGAYDQGSTGIAFSAGTGTGTGTGIGKKCRDRDFAGTRTITGTGTVTGTGISTGTGTEKFFKFSKISFNYTLNSTILRRKSPDT